MRLIDALLSRSIPGSLCQLPAVTAPEGSLDAVLQSANRAARRITAWPKWKRDLAIPERVSLRAEPDPESATERE